MVFSEFLLVEIIENCIYYPFQWRLSDVRYNYFIKHIRLHICTWALCWYVWIYVVAGRVRNSYIWILTSLLTFVVNSFFLSRNKIPCEVFFFSFFLLLFIFFPFSFFLFLFYWREKLMDHSERNNLCEERWKSIICERLMSPHSHLCSPQGMDEYPSLPTCSIHCLPGVVSPHALSLHPELSLCLCCSPVYSRLRMKGKENVKDSLGEKKKAPGEVRHWQKCQWLQ